MAYSISDIDMSTEGKFGVEWEDEYGRFWQWFDTAEEREAAISRNFAKNVDDADEAAMADDEPKDYWNDVASDAEADADTLRSAGMGTDEDYGGCDERY